MIMKLILDRISINKYRLSKNPLKKLYYYYRLHKIIIIMKKIINTSNKFDFGLLLDYIGVCKFLGFKGYKNSPLEEYQVNIMEEEGFTTFADIILREFDLLIKLRIKLQKPQEIQLDYLDLKSDTSYKYELTKEDIKSVKLIEGDTEKAHILRHTNFVLKRYMISSVNKILKGEVEYGKN